MVLICLFVCLFVSIQLKTNRHIIWSLGQVHHKVEKSHSEPVIPPSDDQPKPAKKPRSGHKHRHSHSEARKLSVQSSASTGGGSEGKPRRTSRTHQGASLNEVRSAEKNKSRRAFPRTNWMIEKSAMTKTRDAKTNFVEFKETRYRVAGGLVVFSRWNYLTIILWNRGE